MRSLLSAMCMVALAVTYPVSASAGEGQDRARRFVPSRAIVESLARDDDGRGRRAIDLPIHFEFDSARLTRDGREQAAALGDALLDLAAAARRPAAFLLVGHTDAQGARAYNEALSLRRAGVVRRFLVDEFDFDPRDLEVEGRGEDELLSRETTEAAHSINRRVEVIRLR